MYVSKINSNYSNGFKSLKQIDKTAYKIASAPLKEAYPEIINLSKDVDVEIIGKMGFLTKIKSLIIFVTKTEAKLGEWSSLSIDPKAYMPTEYRYETLKEFTKEDILTGLEQAKERLLKRNSELPKPSLPVDIILLKPLFDKIPKSECKI